MTDNSKVAACIVYVRATASRVADVRLQLEAQGYEVCEASAGDAPILAENAQLPEALVRCIQNAEVCVFLLPEEDNEDGCIGLGAGVAQASEKRIIGVYAGQRTELPEALDEHAESMIRAEGPHLAEAISGVAVWEKPDGQRASDREIVRVRCQ